MIYCAYGSFPHKEEEGKTLPLRSGDKAGGRKAQGGLPGLHRLSGEGGRSSTGGRVGGREAQGRGVRGPVACRTGGQGNRALRDSGWRHRKGGPRDGPQRGEYFLYCVMNRMVDPVSKNALAGWYERTAVQQVRPVDIAQLTSMRYWEKWDRVSEADLERIAQEFFSRVWERESPRPDCLLFDTTNYYTFMASDTPSELARRGKNKDGRHNLRQVGLGLLVARDSRLPLYYRAYAGNLHDSRLFASVMDEMFGVVCGLSATKERLTVVIDKGMNAPGNYAWIDEHSRVHFVTTYSTYFAEELAATPLERFEPADTEKNRRLSEAGHPRERILAYRTTGEYWGKKRAVVVTYNPATARKQAYTLDSKLAELRAELLDMRAKVKEAAPHWRDPEKIRERYLRHCERLHVSSDLFDL